MLPRLAVVDPELTLTLPADVTAATGMDALAQLLEPYVSSRANPITDPLCLDGLARVARSLRRAWTDGADLDARTDMSLAALFGGLALANAALGAVHGFAAAIGGRFDAPHGAVCAALLPGVVRANVAALATRAPDVARGCAICHGSARDDGPRRCPRRGSGRPAAAAPHRPEDLQGSVHTASATTMPRRSSTPPHGRAAWAGTPWPSTPPNCTPCSMRRCEWPTRAVSG